MKVASPQNVEEPYDEVGECERFQPNDVSCGQPLHSVEECKRKSINEDSHVKTKKRRMGKKNIPWHYHFVRYELKYSIEFELQHEIFGK